MACLWYNSWERPREEETEVQAKTGLLNTLLSLAKDSAQPSICAYSVSIWACTCAALAPSGCLPPFYLLCYFVLQHDPAMVAGLNSLNSILQLISTALFIGLCVKKASASRTLLR